MDQIIGESPAIERFRRHLRYLAKDVTPLVFVGEGGTGKSFLAAHIHAASRLCSAPIESLNFSTCPERVLRIGLLGAEPPELTTSRRSLLELKTTLVLKHIDRAGPFLQDKLAEALTSSKVIRLGSSERHPRLARVIFTFRDPIPIMRKKRSLTPPLLEVIDLLHRIHLPPLRDRKDDIPLLTRYYASKLYDKFHCLDNFSVRGINRDGTIDPILLDLLKEQPWEDNMRDLCSFIRSLMLFPFKDEFCNREKLEIVKMTMMIEAEEEFSLPAKLECIEHGIVRRAQQMNKQRSKVARLLGLSERAIGRRMNFLLIAFLSIINCVNCKNLLLTMV